MAWNGCQHGESESRGMYQLRCSGDHANNPAVTLPLSVAIAAGQQSQSFTYSAAVVTVQTGGTVTVLDNITAYRQP